ncbi:ArsR/SmtB family transcription factor [Chryseosolibacter indicus]|uniref:Winged helix-turn-helix domain-containing protein n=1 Tax=Chryseosolibacter indicus TaxID=2782351 RepID=A0ABS5VPB1_9BACT|nr:metalloregulator ArsR/SmtB family transcription factor [Chryseosolibacter indicus]MBT1703176.1 winged helix-turn-helix domain-containing protein [Chryseosolibacter indicus]
MGAVKIQDLKQIEKVSKALGDKHRLNILLHLTKKGGCAACSEIIDIIDLAQPSISHHVKILTEAGLIEAEKEGRNLKYTLNNNILDDYINFLERLKND